MQVEAVARELQDRYLMTEEALKELEGQNIQKVFSKEIERVQTEVRDQKRAIQDARSRVKAIMEQKNYLQHEWQEANLEMN